ncbi:MAG TPA: patatin-like phospholipase family protein [Egibacteraceae bacterium]|nr:patatin-like phospholipase family protein [Egibacteraceae bacterium]
MRLGLVLSGGGAKGSFEAGVLAAVEDAGLRPEVVSGTSAGALNAAALAAGFDAARLAALWTSVSDRDVFRLRRDVWRLPRLRGFAEGGNLAGRLLAAIGWTWFLDTAPLRRTLVEMLGGERVPVRDGLVVTISAVDEATGELVRFTNAPPPPHRTSPRYRVVGLHVDHLLASAAIPLVFRPGVVDGVRYWDGGLVANTPLAPALAYEPDTVIVVTTATRERPAPPPGNLGAALSLLIDNALRHSLLNDLARAGALNTLASAAPAATGARQVDFLLVEPAGLDLGDGLRFDPRRAARNIALGREAGARAIAGWRKEGRLR